MISYVTNKHRLPISTTELNAAFLANEGLESVTNRFIMSVTAETFEERFAELRPELQGYLRKAAVDNIDNFDRVLALLERDGLYTAGWIAFRDWTHRQSWPAQALSQPRGNMVTPEELDELQQRFGAIVLAQHGRQHVGGLNEGMVLPQGERLGIAQGFLEFGG